ncbi:MAG: protein kinase [Myxococcales bacterium]|nr:protein kinase [Myxococcales bacterium]
MQPDPQTKSGNTIDRYEIIAELARGGMGTVLLARVAGAGGFSRLYALKLLHKHLMYDSEFVDMLLDEARIAARIHHPNAVAIHEVGFNEQQGYFVVMDYVEGVTLWDVNQQLGASSPGRVKLCTRIVYDALLGLEAAHTLTDEMGRPLKVVHRDMSPQNILVGVDGIARVTDFGIAKAAARISGTTPGQVKGKLAYMAPEQARGKELDHRVDIFAMGVVLWEMMTGQRLFKRPKDNDTIDALLVKPIPHVREYVPSLPEELDAVIAQALVRDPNQRFGSARAMAVALEHAARSSHLLGDPLEVGNWVRGTFSRALETRREAIRQATAQSAAPRPRGKTGELHVPAIPDVATITPAPSAKTVTDLEDEWEKHSATVSGLSAAPKAPSAPTVTNVPDEALDLMKTTAMPSDGQRPAALREAIEQYRQQYGHAPGAASAPAAGPVQPKPVAPKSNTTPPPPRISQSHMAAVQKPAAENIDSTVPVTQGDINNYYASQPAAAMPPQTPTPAAAPGPYGAVGYGAPPSATTSPLPSGMANAAQQPPQNPYAYAAPHHPTAMYPSPNAGIRPSAPSAAPTPVPAKRNVLQMVLLIVGAIALVATGAIVALKMM